MTAAAEAAGPPSTSRTGGDEGVVAARPGSQVGEIGRATAGLLDIVAGTVEHTHTAVSDRVLRLLGPFGAALRPLHDRVTSLAYRSVRGGLRGAGTLVGAVADHQPRLRRLQPLATPGGVRTLAAVSGIVGDRLATDHPALDLGLELHHEDGLLDPDPAGIAAVHPDAPDELVVFVHGLCEDERSWRRLSRAHRAARRDGDDDLEVVTHGQRLADAHGMAPIYVRYNTGRSVHVNGRRLAHALEEAVDAWPTEIRRIALVGHSMGGLVIRSACHRATREGLAWPQRVSDIVYLGTPHLGAPLARGVHAAARVLAHLPETRGITDFLDHRSEGVRDLTTGEVLAGVTTAEAVGALQDTAGDPPPLPGARHHLLAATITRDPDHPFGRVVGDLMVRADSGSGRSRRRDAGLGDDVVVQGGIDHFDLLSDPEVGAHLLRWLAPTAPVVAGGERHAAP